jgi:hypothetical protein
VNSPQGAALKPIPTLEDHLRAVFAITRDDSVHADIRRLAFDLYRVLHATRPRSMVERLERQRGLR